MKISPYLRVSFLVLARAKYYLSTNRDETWKHMKNNIVPLFM